MGWFQVAGEIAGGKTGPWHEKLIRRDIAKKSFEAHLRLSFARRIGAVLGMVAEQQRGSLVVASGTRSTDHGSCRLCRQSTTFVLTPDISAEQTAETRRERNVQQARTSYFAI